jgi:ribose transport system substrate-binding protein
MKNILRVLGASHGAVTLAASAASASAADKVTLGRRYSHRDARLHRRHRLVGQRGQKGTGEGASRPEGHHQDSGGAPEQANQLQDLVTVNKINALVIFPFESASLTQPVAQVKKKGVYVTVVDRGLTDTSAQDAYVAGDNTAFGKLPAEYLAKTLDGKGDIVALRGIPTTLDNERWARLNR